MPVKIWMKWFGSNENLQPRHELKSFIFNAYMRHIPSYWAQYPSIIQIKDITQQDCWIKHLDQNILGSLSSWRQNANFAFHHLQYFMVWTSSACLAKDNSCFWAESWLWPQVCWIQCFQFSWIYITCTYKELDKHKGVKRLPFPSRIHSLSVTGRSSLLILQYVFSIW